jgi:broad specificity phosphatase PhoE
MTEPLRLYYIRHGETAWSLSGQHTGATDIPLTANGEAGARALGPWLQRVAFTKVLTSPRQRARRTCELAGLGAKAEVEPDLAEWDYGDYEGRLSVDIRADRPGWSIFRDGSPNGETPEAIAARADRLIARLSGVSGAVALFSHGHFGAVLATRWLEMAMIEGRRFPLAPASMSILSVDARHDDTRVLELWNAVPARLAP